MARRRSELASQLTELVRRRQADDALFTHLISSLAASADEAQPELHKASDMHAECVKVITSTVAEKCGGWTSYSFKYHQPLVAFCAKTPQADLAHAIAVACAPASAQAF